MAQTSQVELSQAEIEEAEERAMPRAAVVFETIRRAGEGELSRTISALTFSAISAGLSMGFSLFTMSVFEAYLPDTQQLFTRTRSPRSWCCCTGSMGHILERRAIVGNRHCGQSRGCARVCDAAFTRSCLQPRMAACVRHRRRTRDRR
jgi:hypothetical protein